MRALRTSLAALACAALVTACAGGTGGSSAPAGVTVTREAGYGGTLSDLASQVTTDTVIRNTGAKLQKAEPFAPCPGEAGLQTFELQQKGRRMILKVAFTQWNGTAVRASYLRPAAGADDPKALDALRKAVCSSPVGG